MTDDWTTVKPAPHEIGANLIYTEHDLAPYYALDRRVKDGGGSLHRSMTLGGESWTVGLSYQESGFKPRDDDDFEIENVREFRIRIEADDDVGERDGTFHISPRWPDMESKGDADDPSVPEGILGVNAKIDASNIELDEYPHLLRRAADALDINPDYFDEIHTYSNIYKYERYLRVNRDDTDRIIDSGGVLERVFEHAAIEGKFRLLREDNAEIEGYHHRAEIDSRAAADLIDGHNLAKKIKHYYPEHVRNDPSDPLYHPKVNVRFFASKNADGSVRWSRRHDLESELDETLLNIIHWSGLRIDPGGPYVSDAYFDVVESGRSISIIDDPTPEIRREQDAVVSGHLMSMTESDQDTVEVMADGGVPTVEELAAEAGWSERTIYRVLDRLGDVLDLQNGEVRFMSEYLEQRVRDSLDAAARAVDRDTDAGESSWASWRNRYGVDVDDSGARLVMRFGRVGDALDLRDALKDGLRAWIEAARDPGRYRKARIEFERAGHKQVQMGFNSAR